MNTYRNPYLSRNADIQFVLIMALCIFTTCLFAKNHKYASFVENPLLTCFTNHLKMLRDESATSGNRRMELSFMCESMHTNTVSSLLNDLSDVKFESLISDYTNETVHLGYHAFFCHEGDYVWFAFVFGTTVTNTNYLDRVERRIRFYVNERIAGHSKRYLYDAINQTKRLTFSISPRLPSNVIYRYWIPVTWIKKLKDDTEWIVIDGSFAWIYDKDGFCQKRDSKEYDPKYKSQFKAARDEAMQILNNKGIKLIDSTVLLDIQIQQILHDKFNINWTRPDELNSIND